MIDFRSWVNFGELGTSSASTPTRPIESNRASYPLVAGFTSNWCNVTPTSWATFRTPASSQKPLVGGGGVRTATLFAAGTASTSSSGRLAVERHDQYVDTRKVAARTSEARHRPGFDEVSVAPPENDWDLRRCLICSLHRRRRDGHNDINPGVNQLNGQLGEQLVSQVAVNLGRQQPLGESSGASGITQKADNMGYCVNPGRCSRDQSRLRKP
jgi:hypothetical protein